MFKNYISTALRFLKKNKVFAIVNIFGLSLALAASFIMLMYVINELSYDTHHKNRKQVYRVINHLEELKMTMAGTPYILAETMKEEFPQVEKAVGITFIRGFKLKLNDEFVDIRGTYGTGSEIFDIFTLPLLGSKLYDKLLEDQNALVLSQTEAELFFPGEDPVGKEILGMINNEEQFFTVTAVMEDAPKNATFRPGCLVNIRWTVEQLNRSFGIDYIDISWEHDYWRTWILLSENSNPASLENQFRTVVKKYIGEDAQNTYALQPLSDVYLKSEDIGNTGVQGKISNVKLFTGIAFIILLIAAINYIILSTAVSTGRAKEIAIRKAAGASDKSIRNQLLSESIMLALFVLPLAIVIMWIGIPYASELFNTKLQVYSSNMVIYIFVYLVLTVFIGIASGLYTSSYLSRLKVLEILENTMHAGEGKQWFRSVLIIIQLVIFCSFVAATLIIRSQYEYAMTRDPGHYKENVVLVNLGRRYKEYTPFINAVKANANVISAAGTMYGLPMTSSMNFVLPHFQNEDQNVKMEGMALDYHFLETMGIEKTRGRYFSEEYGTDLQESVILNEKAVEALGIDDPIGQMIDSLTIVGVVENFNLHTIHSEVPPLKISLTDKYVMQVAVHYRVGSRKEVLTFLEDEWKKANPDRAFSCILIEDLIEALYKSEKNLGSIVSIFALFTLLIAAFGLFGLTLFIARSRTHEIGIRKVFGSSERSIIYSFMRSNLILVSVSSLLSVPITLYFMNKWLNNYAFREEISWLVFLAAFAFAAIVVLATVFFHSYKASRINPVEALRHQ